MQRILDQVNSRFDYLNNKIEKLEARLNQQPKARTMSNKKVEEKA